MPLFTHLLSKYHNTYPRGLIVSLIISCLRSTQILDEQYYGNIEHYCYWTGRH